jgi:hypothetical protein
VKAGDRDEQTIWDTQNSAQKCNGKQGRGHRRTSQKLAHHNAGRRSKVGNPCDRYSRVFGRCIAVLPRGGASSTAAFSTACFGNDYTSVLCPGGVLDLSPLLRGNGPVGIRHQLELIEVVQAHHSKLSLPGGRCAQNASASNTADSQTDARTRRSGRRHR